MSWNPKLIPSALPLTALIGLMTDEVKQFYAKQPKGQIDVLALATTTNEIHSLSSGFRPLARDEIYAEWKGTLKEIGAKSYVIASEAWLGRAESLTPPSTQHDRREVVIVIAASAAGETLGVMLEMQRDSKGRVKTLVPDGDERPFYGPMAELLA